jgi:hypothetical protein
MSANDVRHLLGAFIGRDTFQPNEDNAKRGAPLEHDEVPEILVIGEEHRRLPDRCCEDVHVGAALCALLDIQHVMPVRTQSRDDLAGNVLIGEQPHALASSPPSVG